MNEDWTSVHDLALLYVACAYRGDNEMGKVERESVRTMLLIRFPEIERAEADRVVNEVFLTYLGDTGSRLLSSAVLSLRDMLSRGERARVLEELTGIASSDGIVLPGEVDFISDVARAWQIRGSRADS